MIPSQSNFNLPPTGDAGKLAQACARQAGMDIGAFVGCTGRQVILPEREQAMLDCAVSNRATPDFARCAAKATGVRLPDEQAKLAGCAVKSRGETIAFQACMGGEIASRALSPSERAVLACAAKAGGSAAFTQCASSQFLDGQQQAVLNCALDKTDLTAFAACAAPNAGIKMSDQQRIIARCAAKSKGNRQEFATCTGSALLGAGMGEKEAALLACASRADGDNGKFAGCAAARLLGGDVSREQEIAIRCAAESGGDLGTFGACAGANMFNLQLNPEQQIAVQCVVSSGGNPPAAAGCMASRLTLRELSKCVSDGVGGDGCFGDSNDLVGRSGFVRRTFGQIAGGSNSVINNPGQIWGGDNSFVRNPGQIWGGSNSFVRNPGQIWGGPNSVFNKPAQLAPKPVTLGTVGGKRICLPWC